MQLSTHFATSEFVAFSDQVHTLVPILVSVVTHDSGNMNDKLWVMLFSLALGKGRFVFFLMY